MNCISIYVLLLHKIPKTVETDVFNLLPVSSTFMQFQPNRICVTWLTPFVYCHIILSCETLHGSFSWGFSNEDAVVVSVPEWESSTTRIVCTAARRESVSIGIMQPTFFCTFYDKESWEMQTSLWSDKASFTSKNTSLQFSWQLSSKVILANQWSFQTEKCWQDFGSPQPLFDWATKHKASLAQTASLSRKSFFAKDVKYLQTGRSIKKKNTLHNNAIGKVWMLFPGPRDLNFPEAFPIFCRTIVVFALMTPSQLVSPVTKRLLLLLIKIDCHVGPGKQLNF